MKDAGKMDSPFPPALGGGMKGMKEWPTADISSLSTPSPFFFRLLMLLVSNYHNTENCFARLGGKGGGRGK